MKDFDLNLQDGKLDLNEMNILWTKLGFEVKYENAEFSDDEIDATVFCIFSSILDEVDDSTTADEPSYR